MKRPHPVYPNRRAWLVLGPRDLLACCATRTGADLAIHRLFPDEEVSETYEPTPDGWRVYKIGSVGRLVLAGIK